MVIMADKTPLELIRRSPGFARRSTCSISVAHAAMSTTFATMSSYCSNHSSTTQAPCRPPRTGRNPTYLRRASPHPVLDEQERPSMCNIIDASLSLAPIEPVQAKAVCASLAPTISEISSLVDTLDSLLEPPDPEENPDLWAFHLIEELVLPRARVHRLAQL